MIGRIHIGTSGWHYEDWKGPFYQDNLRTGDMLASYAERFRAVEINNTFYHLPEVATLEAWRETVPEDFIFAVKASRYITHMKKLKDPEKPVGRFLERIDILGERLGPILFQLPPNWSCNPDRLENFLGRLSRQHRCVFEFRDQSWFVDEVYQLLENAGAAFCIYDLAGRVSPKIVTTDFVYVRLHGPDAAYQGSYSSQVLSGWAGAFSTWMQQGKELFCFFDNDQHGYAPLNAMCLQEMLGTYNS
ncbi:MAG: DUF72 domain-containing protein [Desulfuromonadales bacterium]|nr:DUF72 domain-containing protein [Desulfuromonadales bacterium]